MARDSDSSLANKTIADNEGEVEFIDRVDDEHVAAGFRLFWVKFKGYPYLTKITERGMYGCQETLNEWLSYRGMPQFLFVPADDDSLNLGPNAVPLSTVLDKIRYLKSSANSPYSEGCDIIEYDKRTFKRKGERVALDLLSGHFFVYLKEKNFNLAWVADGSNYLRNTPTDLAWISKHIGLPIRLVNFNEQLNVDHCASSAIIIALEFSIRRLCVRDSQGMRDALVRELHPHPSRPLENLSSTTRESEPSRPVDPRHCGACNRTFRNAHGLKIHMGRKHK